MPIMNKNLLALLLCVFSLALLPSCRKDCDSCEPCGEPCEEVCEVRSADECPGCEDCDPCTEIEAEDITTINKF